MSGVYSYNKFFDSTYLAGKENLLELEDEVHTDESVVSSVIGDYETAIEEDWPDFIINFCE
ncbi:MAG: hypothetical protein LBL51_00760 [Synergistaceae bacterium]|jgi:hypothetical protein|nr:hypothetical protein [Synergistaceae bacterium]